MEMVENGWIWLKTQYTINYTLYPIHYTLSTIHYTWSDFLKAKSIVQSNCSDWKFCTKTCVRNYIKECETNKKCQIVTNTWN